MQVSAHSLESLRSEPSTLDVPSREPNSFKGLAGVEDIFGKLLLSRICLSLEGR